ncbi:magnesium transporter NIPA-domain-containing protein [Phascolomyces articulosus]|uniref:Magnesium transporter NIPA-domain-containing protein n=1 Tax=Phascolomyces articulosus TaxID=60185 RepID=A0AAD5PIY1_9FUNG|nr:magnesium transporter NIPA-domain-containing protein [Phascolomyces articulosus]
MDSKYIGLILAICSSFLIGISFVITKKGLQQSSSASQAFASDSHRYLKSPIWWVGIITMVSGEILNFIGYTFAPAILITPLGALSVIIGAILATLFLKEKLGAIGIIGCLLSLIGAVIIVLHAPEDPQVASVEELVNYMLQPGFIVYFVLVILITGGMIWKVVPRWGKTKVMVYVTICSLIGSLSVMTIKAFGIAVRLTAEGNNQFTQPSTYVFGFMCIVFILTQVNYFNKALDTFSTNVVNPIYFVFFTTATIIASAIMYRGWHTANAVNTASLICGFIIIFSGVYLLDSIARKSKGSVPLPPVASASSLHRYDSKSNISQRTASVVMMEAAEIKLQLQQRQQQPHIYINSKRMDRCESSGSKVSCRRKRRALSV